MKRIILALVISLSVMVVNAQEVEKSDKFANAATRLLQQDGKLKIGGYGQIDYNQEINSDVRKNGKMDVHRLVMLFGYKFNDRTQFITELEFEHVKEVYVEQAFLDYKINNFINFRGGLMLVPMGIINEYHEPTTFSGVERPLIDKYIAPTTWREIGAGFTGNFIDQSLRYQLYVMNGFNGYDDGGKLRSKDGLRKGRQKGAESYISSPNLATKVEYYGIPNLNLGLSGYFGNTQSTAYDGIDKDDSAAEKSADSTVVGIAMVGADARYLKDGLQLRGQLYYTALSNTDEYNKKTGKDLGSSMYGYYAEVGYNVFHNSTRFKTDLVPFVRFSQWNTQNSMESGFEASKSNEVTAITTGFGLKLAKGAVLKADMQFIKSEADDDYKKMLNLGIGIWF